MHVGVVFADAVHELEAASQMVEDVQRDVRAEPTAALGGGPGFELDAVAEVGDEAENPLPADLNELGVVVLQHDGAASEDVEFACMGDRQAVLGVAVWEIEFGGEEDVDSQSTPAKDLGSACMIGALAIAGMILSLQLDAPDGLYTAPGLLPFITSLSLLLMALLLGTKSLQAGGAREFTKAFRQAAEAYFSSAEERRAMLLIAIVVVYVLLVGTISFDLHLPTPVFDFRISSYEVISVVISTLIMRLFWKAPLMRCALVSVLTILILASIFRYGFGIVMPESF